MRPWRTLGPDRFHAGFFQSQWHLLGKDICNEVDRVMNGGSLGGGLNNILISLIPKVSPMSIKSFRPIALCTILYKIITKLIADRIKGLFPSLISSNQTSFCLGQKHHRQYHHRSRGDPLHENRKRS